MDVENCNIVYDILKPCAIVGFVPCTVQGLIQTRAPLDRESVPMFAITVEARDNINAPAAQQRVTPGYMQIFLLDVNDNHPQFEQDVYEATTLENAKINHVFVTIRATDADEGPNSQVVYSIDLDNSNSTDHFEIDASSGQVYVRNSLQGKMGHYIVVVVATDMGNPPLSNSTYLFVTVEDVNDHPPEIVSPPENFTINIMEVSTLVETMSHT